MANYKDTKKKEKISIFDKSKYRVYVERQKASALPVKSYSDWKKGKQMDDRQSRPIGTTKAVTVIQYLNSTKVELFDDDGSFTLWALDNNYNEINDLYLALSSILGDKLPMCCGANCHGDNPHICSDLCKNGPQKA